MSVIESEIREGRKVRGTDGKGTEIKWIEVRESDATVAIQMGDYSSDKVLLTVDQARRFARQIYNIARRVDNRT